jgi:hypothetical protein
MASISSWTDWTRHPGREPSGNRWLWLASMDPMIWSSLYFLTCTPPALANRNQRLYDADLASRCRPLATGRNWPAASTRVAEIGAILLTFECAPQRPVWSEQFRNSNVACVFFKVSSQKFAPVSLDGLQ